MMGKQGIVVTMTLFLVLGLTIGSTLAGTESLARKRPKQLPSVFNIISFPNDPCNPGTGQNGTCYSEEDCANRGGSNAGSCADGYGVCCVFTAGCGVVLRENLTYFESTGAETDSSECRLTVCPLNSNICQLRLDFNQFVINGPSTSTASADQVLAGKIFGATPSNPVSLASRCDSDVFSVTNPDGNAPPAICGSNTNEHMYVSSSAACNDLVFLLGSAGTTNRQWSILVTQLECDSLNLAPEGCTQYFRSESGIVSTFNYQGGQHLSEQDQNICVRRERGNCRICWTTMQDTDFVLSGAANAMVGYNKISECCGYGQDGANKNGYDCVVIPGAEKTTATAKSVSPHICGRSKGLVTADGAANTAKTICSTRLPFSIRFLSDAFEYDVEAAAPDKGFQLVFQQDNNNCPPAP